MQPAKLLIFAVVAGVAQAEPGANNNELIDHLDQNLGGAVSVSTPETLSKPSKGPKVKGSKPGKEADDVAPFQRELTALRSSIDLLGSDVDALISRVNQESGATGTVAITSQLQPPAPYVLWHLAVKLDGAPIFTSDPGEYLWLPQDTFPLFQGPMPPGQHRLDVSLEYAQTQANGVAIPREQIVSKSFPFQVESASGNKAYRLTLVSTPDQMDIALNESSP